MIKSTEILAMNLYRESPTNNQPYEIKHELGHQP